MLQNNAPGVGSLPSVTLRPARCCANHTIAPVSGVCQVNIRYLSYTLHRFAPILSSVASDYKRQKAVFYAVEYAYGRNVENNGARADQVLEFTRRALRDAWVKDGSLFNDAGSRDPLSARSPLVRKAHGLEDGDNEGWQVIAENRVNASRQLSAYKSIIFHDWGDNGHARWVATASEKEITSWAKAIKEDEKE